MGEPPAKKKRIHAFQESWASGRPWLRYDPDSGAMTCSVCSKHSKTRGGCGSGQNSWVSGCKRLKVEVVRQHEASKAHRDAEAAEQTRSGVEKQGGLFARQIVRRDNTTMFAMKLLYWLVKENIALDKWNSLKGKKHSRRSLTSN